MDFAQGDSDLLKALADLHRADDIVAVTKACETFREIAVRQLDRLAIGADALRLFAQTRGKSIDLNTKEWQEFLDLANGIEKRANTKRRSNNARQKNFRRLRLFARLTVLWGSDVLEHYNFTDWSSEKLENLAKCAEKLPDFVHFAAVSNYVLLERHEKSLTSNMSDRIGHHSFRNQYSNAMKTPQPHQPLQNRDVNRVLHFVQSKATLNLNGCRCDRYEHLNKYSNRIEEWLQDDIGNTLVAGKQLREYPRFQTRHYQLGYDMYGLLVPREYGEEAYRSKGQQKRQRERHTGAVGNEINGIDEGQTPARKRKRTQPNSFYPSPQASSAQGSPPQETMVPSPTTPVESDSDARLDEDSSDAGCSCPCQEEIMAAERVEQYSSHAERMMEPILPHGERRSSVQLGTPSSTCLRTQSSSAQTASPLSGLSPSVRPSQSRPAVPLSSAHSGRSMQASAFSQELNATSHFDDQQFSQFKDSSEVSPSWPASTILNENRSLFPMYHLPPPDTASSARSFSSLLTYPPDTPSVISDPSVRSHIVPDDDHGTRQSIGLAEQTRGLNSSSPSHPAISNLLSFPQFRPLTSDTNAALSTTANPSGSLSPATNEIVNLSGHETQRNLSKDIAVSHKESGGELVAEAQDSEQLQAKLSAVETSQSAQTDLQNPLALGCQICKGVCTHCRVPTNFDSSMRNKLFELGHRAHELARLAPNATLRQWISPIHFADHSQYSTEGSGDVHVLSLHGSRDQVDHSHTFMKPTIIREEFADRKEWTVSRYADLLELTFEGTQVDVKFHRRAQPERVPVSQLVELLRCQPSRALSENPPNFLNLPDITDAIAPRFLRVDRFRLLNLVIERCRADLQKHLGKLIHTSPFDIGNSRRFNILGWPGAFSGPHVDSNGATWVRNLFGYKLWMFVPKSEMGPEDWEQFAVDGDKWDPQGRNRAVILEPGDVFVMDPGLVHAVYTLGNNRPCLMTGGIFLDQNDLVRSLETLYWILENQNATNEPIPYQLAQIVSTLQGVVERASTKWFSEDVLLKLRRAIESLRSLGCDCEDCSSECRCSQENRRCTPLCAAHSTNGPMAFSCMLEGRDEDTMSDGADHENSDEEYLD